MSEGKLVEIEPSFNIDDWMNELLPDTDSSDNYRMERAGFSVPSSNLNNSIQQNKPIQIEENYQVATTTSNIKSSLSRNPENTSGYGFIGGPSNYRAGGHFSSILHHHAPAQVIERPNNNPSSELLNAYLSTNNQRPLRSQSPSFMMRSQESCSNVIQQADQIELEMRLQQISRQLQMEQQLKMQSAPWESTIQAKMANSNDWVEHALHQILLLKEMYLPEVVSLYNRASELRNQTLNPETVARCEYAMMLSENPYTFLHMSRADIFCHGKENFSLKMNRVRLNLDRIRATNFHLMQQAQYAEARQRVNVPKFYGTFPVSSYQVGSSSGVKKSDATSRMNANRYSLMRSSKQPSPSQISSPNYSSQFGYEQGSSTMPPHPSNGVPQHINLSDLQKIVASSQNIVNSSDSCISAVTRNYLVTTSEKNNCQKMTKSDEQLLSEQHMQQIMHKSNDDSAMRQKSRTVRNSQHSSSLTEFSKSRTSSLSASKTANPSPLNPLTPCSKLVDSEKSSLSLEEGSGVPRSSHAQIDPSLQELNQNHGVMDSRELRNCPLVPKSTCLDQNESSTDKGDPFNRLINVVKSMSSKELDASLREMSVVANMTDRISGSFLLGEPTMDIVNDLVVDTRKRIDQKNLRLICGTGMEPGMKRRMDSIDLTAETEYGASSNSLVKRPRKEVNDQLLQEIREINQKLIEVVVDVRAGRDEGTSIVRCSYHPIGLYGNNSLPNTSLQTFPFLVLELNVTADYPHSSHVILETEPTCCSESEEGKDMWRKAMSNFNSALRKSTQPVSLKEMAKTWDFCAREVYRQFAQRNGGGDFSSKYGMWETCVVAS